MHLDKDTLERISKAFPKSHDLVNIIIDADYITGVLCDIDVAIHNEEKRHSDAIKALKTKRAEIRAKCCHPAWRRHPDPSGNNGSFDECVVCGMES